MRKHVKKFVSFLLIASLLITMLPSVNVFALQDGLARTPPMGFNTYNANMWQCGEVLFKQICDGMVANGMQDAGYLYVNSDAAWCDHDRYTPEGGHTFGDPRSAGATFPGGLDGVKTLSEYIRSKGMKWGVYHSLRHITLAGGNINKIAEELDYIGIDFIKIDWLDSQFPPLPFVNAIRSYGNKVVISLSADGNPQKGDQYGHMWRTSGDIDNNWSSVLSCFNSAMNNTAASAL